MIGLEVRTVEEFPLLQKPKEQKTKICQSSLFRSTKGASKQRRDLINSEIGRLRDLLPLPESARQRLSQLQIMSLTCVYIRKCNYFARLFGNTTSSTKTPFEFAQSMNGFLLTTTREGKLLYISENVTEYLGHSMVDMLTQGDSFYDIIDKKDHATAQSHLLHTPYSPSATAPGISDEKAFFCRMNVSRSFRRQAGFGDHKVMHIRGHFVTPMVRDHYGNQPVFTAICSPLITPDVKETIIQNNTMAFQTVHGLDMKYMEMAHNGEHHLGFTDEEIKGKSWYELLHPEDLSEAKEKHIQLIKSSHEMGCMLTVRLMSKFGEWVWMNMVMHIRQPFLCDNGEPAIVCINHVIQAEEAPGFKLQSQLYSSHIARSPEIFSSANTGSPQYSITQVSSPDHGGSDYASGGLGQTEQESSGYYQGEGHVTAASTGTHGSSVSSGGEEVSGQKSRMGSLSDSNSSMKDEKQLRRADILNRLKRKMSESKEQCKPAKIAKKQPDIGGQANQGNDISYSASVIVSSIFPEDSFRGMGSADGGVSTAASLAVDTPVYVQLKPDLGINVKEQMEVKPIEVINPPTPLTPASSVASSTSIDSPESVMSHQTTTDIAYSGLNSLMVEVSEAIVPPSLLTPDASPVCSPQHSAGSPAQVMPVENYLPTLLSDLEDTSLFADMDLEKKPAKVKMEVIDESMPQLDAMYLEQYLECITSPKPEPDVMLLNEPCVEIKEEPLTVEADDILGGLCDESDLNSMVAHVTDSILSMVQPNSPYSICITTAQPLAPLAGHCPDPLMTTTADLTEDDLINDMELSNDHGDLMNELHQLNQLASNSTPSYGDEDLASAFLSSTL